MMCFYYYVTVTVCISCLYTIVTVLFPSTLVAILLHYRYYMIDCNIIDWITLEFLQI